MNILNKILKKNKKKLDSCIYKPELYKNDYIEKNNADIYKDIYKENNNVNKTPSMSINNESILNMICIADTHGCLNYDSSKLEEELNREKPDIVITLGDIRKDELKLIESLTDDDIPIYGIKGNHDDIDQFDDTRVIDLNGAMVDIQGIKITGIEGSIKYKEDMIGFSQDESMIFAKSLQSEADILFSHCHGYRGKADDILGQYNVHIGLEGIRWYINQNNCVNIYGHDHISTEMINDKELRIYHIQRAKYCNNKLFLT